MIATFTLLALFLNAISANYVANNAMISLADIGNDQAATALSCLEDAKVDRAFNTTATSPACQQVFGIVSEKTGSALMSRRDGILTTDASMANETWNAGRSKAYTATISAISAGEQMILNTVSVWKPIGFVYGWRTVGARVNNVTAPLVCGYDRYMDVNSTTAQAYTYSCTLKYTSKGDKVEFLSVFVQWPQRPLATDEQTAVGSVIDWFSLTGANPGMTADISDLSVSLDGGQVEFSVGQNSIVGDRSRVRLVLVRQPQYGTFENLNASIIGLDDRIAYRVNEKFGVNSNQDVAVFQAVDAQTNQVLDDAITVTIQSQQSPTIDTPKPPNSQVAILNATLGVPVRLRAAVNGEQSGWAEYAIGTYKLDNAALSNYTLLKVSMAPFDQAAALSPDVVAKWTNVSVDYLATLTHNGVVNINLPASFVLPTGTSAELVRSEMPAVKMILSYRASAAGAVQTGTVSWVLAPEGSPFLPASTSTPIDGTRQDGWTNTATWIVVGAIMAVALLAIFGALWRRRFERQTNQPRALDTNPFTRPYNHQEQYPRNFAHGRGIGSGIEQFQHQVPVSPLPTHSMGYQPEAYTRTPPPTGFFNTDPVYGSHANDPWIGHDAQSVSDSAHSGRYGTLTILESEHHSYTTRH